MLNVVTMQVKQSYILTQLLLISLLPFSFKKQNSLAIADGSVKSSDNSSTIKDKNHSNITSLEEFFLAKPGHAFHFPQQSSGEYFPYLLMVVRLDHYFAHFQLKFSNPKI